jgi:serine/threonine-protein kinase
MQTANCLSREVLQGLLDAALPTQETRPCEQHLEACPHCRAALEQLAGPSDWWEQAAEHLSTRLEQGDSPTGSRPNVDPWLSASSLATAGGDSASRETADRTTAEREFDVEREIRAEREVRAEQRAQQDAQTLALQRVRAWLAPGHPELLGKLADYDIESVIGQGGFGVVLRGFDRELNRPVAIKVLAPHLATVGAARRRFIREAQAAAAVVHPNVVPIHAVQAEADYPFLVMTYVPGGSLQQCVRRQGPLEPKAIVRIAQQVAAGLAAAHRQGLVHRDIKPGNILLENGLNRALITDFGLARAADDAASQTGWLAGTPHYMSPEQAASESLDGRSDLFSLGSVMYFMATGREPFGGDKPLAILNQIAHKRPPAIRSINADVPNTLVRIIDRLLEKRPADRFESALQVSELLEQYLAYMQQPDQRRKPHVPRKGGRQLWLRSSALFGAALLLLAAAGLTEWWDGFRNSPANTGMLIGPTGNDSPSVRNDPPPGPGPEIPEVANPAFQAFIEWQRAEATWSVEGAALTKELAAVKAAVEQLEQAEQAQRASLSGDFERLWDSATVDGPSSHWSQDVRDIEDRLRPLETGSGD